MVSFFVYDIAFLVVFMSFVIWFLYHNKEKVRREGIIFMFRTQFGVKAIKKVSNKFSGFLRGIKYFVIAVGFFLMGAILWMLGRTGYIYLKHPEITEVVKAPPIAPLIPYFPELFGMKSFFPPFYFTYFILALAIVAIVHEFSHGIFMHLFKIKIKSTGLVFLGPLLGAFVEENRNEFYKKKKNEQMAVLAAGTFANVVTGIVFGVVLILIFNFCFAAGGFVFNSYATTQINVSDISSMGQENLTCGTEEFVGLNVEGQRYFLDEARLNYQLDNNLSTIVVFMESPALKNCLRGAITEVGGEKVGGMDDLKNILSQKSPGERVEITTRMIGEVKTQEIVLDEHPENSSGAFLGVAYLPTRYREDLNFFERAQLKMGLTFEQYKNPQTRGSTYFIPSFDGNFVIFVYNLIWWIVLINILVALFNMAPLGILDGGRFFYLTILSITKSEKIANYSFKAITYLILFLFIALTFIWLFRIL